VEQFWFGTKIIRQHKIEPLPFVKSTIAAISMRDAKVRTGVLPPHPLIY
jgi:hypothetical protein